MLEEKKKNRARNNQISNESTFSMTDRRMDGRESNRVIHLFVCQQAKQANLCARIAGKYSSTTQRLLQICSIERAEEESGKLR